MIAAVFEFRSSQIHEISMQITLIALFRAPSPRAKAFVIQQHGANTLRKTTGALREYLSAKLSSVTSPQTSIAVSLLNWMPVLHFFFFTMFSCRYLWKSRTSPGMASPVWLRIARSFSWF